MQECLLYLVSPSRITLNDFLPILRDVLATGAVKAFQLRLKDTSDADIIAAATAIAPLCQAQDTAFILNDRADLVIECGADGVHLGQDDMPVAEARRIIGNDRIIGVSCHASRDMGFVAAESGADYVAFGAFFPTTSKPQEKIERWGVPDISLIEWWATYTTLPCVAIGGMTPENCMPLVNAGADFIAAINAVWQHPQGAVAAVNAFAAVLRDKTHVS